MPFTIQLKYIPANIEIIRIDLICSKGHTIDLICFVLFGYFMNGFIKYKLITGEGI